jgi:hypothetical protein
MDRPVAAPRDGQPEVGALNIISEMACAAAQLSIALPGGNDAQRA